MQTNGNFSRGPAAPKLEWRPVESVCAGFREDTNSIYGRDQISIRGMSEQSAHKNNPQFLAILEDRVVSFLA